MQPCSNLSRVVNCENSTIVELESIGIFVYRIIPINITIVECQNISHTSLWNLNIWSYLYPVFKNVFNEICLIRVQIQVYLQRTSLRIHWLACRSHFITTLQGQNLTTDICFKVQMFFHKVDYLVYVLKFLIWIYESVVWNISKSI